ncbi:hypothetical protein ACIBI8_37455 [Streptomyces sp. NPDC050529]|uniref:hypothetical protein n=1 Tax=Streptomyces sp. NPDC050529 TaxID=3365624 RepID=UPI0037909E11
MTVYPIAVAVAAAAVVSACTAWWRLHRLQGDIRRFRAAVRLTEAVHHRDVEAFQRRIQAAVDEHRTAEAVDQLLAEAEAIVTAELARTTHHNPQEGDTP